ncbi:MAG: MBL fold metallo-hydrolase [Pyrinomonadaceae bacterium]
MKLTVFQSGKGDSLLLTGADGRRLLSDGGTGDAYSEHVAPALGALRDAGETLDVVYLSHIDDDHIGGVLRLMDDEIDWRVHDFQLKGGNTSHKPPAAPRPPKVGAIWHNAFHEQVGQNSGAIEDMLAASAAVLSGSENAVVRRLATEQSDLATSVAQSLKLARRVSPEQLGIKLNPPAKGKLMMLRADVKAIKVGGMRFTIIGPPASELTKLRKDWNNWLEKNEKQLDSIQKGAGEDEKAIGANAVGEIMLPKAKQADALASLLPLAPAKFVLGERKKVTTPNLASLMFFVQEGKKTLLLTGDGHHLDILDGLRKIKKLKASGGLHVDVLKVQHHGSEYNLDEVFCRTITADNYVFCGDGEHENPDLRVLQAIADSRLGTADQLSKNKEVGDAFKFWFNNSSAATKKADAKAHMKKVEKLVAKLISKSGGRMTSFFLKGDSFELQI